MKAITNREARSKYEFLQSWEAGLVLKGYEVKAVKAGRLNLKGSYIGEENGELWLKNTHISPYQRLNMPKGYEAERPRKLLLHRQQIEAILKKSSQKGLTLIPEKVYSSAGLVKVRVTLARGLKQADRRDKIKKRELDRQSARLLRNKG